MIEEVKLKLPDKLKPVHHECEVMIARHEGTAPEWWYRVGTLRFERGTYYVQLGPQQFVGGFTTSDQVVFVRERNRHMILELARKADELRDFTKKRQAEIADLERMLGGNRGKR